MVIKRLSSAGLFTHPHYQVILSADYSGTDILHPILWAFWCAGLFGSFGDAVVDLWWQGMMLSLISIFLAHPLSDIE